MVSLGHVLAIGCSLCLLQHVDCTNRMDQSENQIVTAYKKTQQGDKAQENETVKKAAQTNGGEAPPARPPTPSRLPAPGCVADHFDRCSAPLVRLLFSGDRARLEQAAASSLPYMVPRPLIRNTCRALEKFNRCAEVTSLSRRCPEHAQLEYLQGMLGYLCGPGREEYEKEHVRCLSKASLAEDMVGTCGFEEKVKAAARERAAAVRGREHTEEGRRAVEESLCSDGRVGECVAGHVEHTCGQWAGRWVAEAVQNRVRVRGEARRVWYRRQICS